MSRGGRRCLAGAGLALAVLVLAGCGAPEEEPAAVVRRYFASLSVDPIRTLPLLTPRFHAAHGLHVVTTDEARRWDAGEGADPLGRAEGYAVDRHQLAWLAVQTRGSFRELRDGLRTEVLATETDGDRARVRVRVTPGAGPPFEQDFALVRQAGGAWRIEAIEQQGVAAAARGAAFAAHPTESARRALAEALRARAAGSP